MSKNPFKDYFDDVSDLKVNFENKVLKKVTGTAVLNKVIYRITIRRNDLTNSQNSHKTLYSGTISIIDPLTNRVMISETRKREREAKGKTYTDKDVYATITFHCNSNKLNDFVIILMRQINSLWKQNLDQLKFSLREAVMPQNITPQLAVEKYVENFIKITYPFGSDESKFSKACCITRAMNFLPEIPICKLKQRNVDKRFNANHVGESTTDLCYLFVQFLIDRKIVEGSNPFHPVKKTQPSEKKLEKAAFSQQELGEEVFRKMFDLLNNEITPTNCVIALLISGFTLKDISDLIWGDIEFVREHKDFAVIHIRKEYLRAAKHDFSRPAIPDTALYLRKAHAKFSKECQANFEDVPIKPKELDSRKVAAAVNNLLVMAGFNGQLTAAGRPSSDEPIPIQVLRTNYERMLNDCAGLKDDPDTRNFLLGRLFKSSTYINYESHTSEEAQYRLYTILKPLAVEAKINKKSGITKYSDKLVYEAFPNSNHEVVQITGKITFRCNQQIKIQSAHGVTGYFEVVDNY